MALPMVKRRRKKRRLTEKQMIISEAKMLRRMMRSSESERINRLRRLRLTDSTRLPSQTANEQSRTTSREVLSVGRARPRSRTTLG